MNEAQHVVIETAIKYRIDVLLLTGEHTLPKSFSHGPMGGVGLSFRKNSLAICPNAKPEDILHEMAHLIVGSPSMWLSEGFVLMPFEWELAKHLAKKMDRRFRRRFMRGVHAYQEGTRVGRFQTVLEEFGPGVRRTKWWRHGIDRAKRLGLLYTNKSPTFLRAEWAASGLPRRAYRWDPIYDERFP